MSSDWAATIREYRRRKDEQFASDPGSPLPPDERESFDGLDYYPVDPDYRFVLPLDRYDDPEGIVVATTADREREYLRCGEFCFEVDGRSVALQAYRADPDVERLWVPFRDATSGEDTYGAGRYVDLDPDDHRDGGEWVLDFNLAYNPTCAYSDRYECPLPPAENWLDVPIRAGEQTYGEH